MESKDLEAAMRDLLRKLFAELAATERQAHEAVKRADGLRQAIAGLQSALPQSRLDLPEPAAEGWQIRQIRRASVVAANGKVPGTTEAILRILGESDKSVSVEEIRAEFDRRGWTNRNSKDPNKLIYETLRRLSAQDPPRIRRIRRGRYMAVKKPRGAA